MIVVFDANVLVSMAVARPGGTIAALLSLWRDGAFQVVISAHIFDEFRRALGTPFFAQRLQPHDVAVFIAFVRTASSFVEAAAPIARLATHPEDDLVLACAVTAGADLLVTGDRQLQALSTVGNVPIVDPGTALTILLP